MMATRIVFASPGDYPLSIVVEEELQDVLDAIHRAGGDPFPVTDMTARKTFVNRSAIAYIQSHDEPAGGEVTARGAT